MDLGGEVAALKVGDLVTVPPLIPCWSCERCADGQFSLCTDYDYFGSRSDGAYAQYVKAPANNVLRVPDGLDPVAAAMIDPAAIALHAVWKTRLRHGPAKAALMRQAGATAVAGTAEEALQGCPRGFDVVIESAGAPATVDMAAAICAPQGEAVFIGIPHAPVELDKATYEHFLRQEITLHGSWNSFSAPFPGQEWRTTATKLADGSLAWEFMITHRLGPDELPTTIKALGDRSILSSKVLFFPNGQ